MNFGITADASGIIDSIQRIMNAAESTTGPFGEAKEGIGEDYLEAMRDRFQSGGDGEWEQRKSVGDGHPLLNKTGDLFDSLIPGNEKNILDVLPDGTDAGTSLPKSVPLHFGAPARKLPARPILVDPPQPTIDDMGARLAEGITESAT